MVTTFIPRFLIVYIYFQLVMPYHQQFVVIVCALRVIHSMPFHELTLKFCPTMISLQHAIAVTPPGELKDKNKSLF